MAAAVVHTAAEVARTQRRRGRTAAGTPATAALQWRPPRAPAAAPIAAPLATTPLAAVSAAIAPPRGLPRDAAFAPRSGEVELLARGRPPYAMEVPLPAPTPFLSAAPVPHDANGARARGSTTEGGIQSAEGSAAPKPTAVAPTSAPAPPDAHTAGSAPTATCAPAATAAPVAVLAPTAASAAPPAGGDDRVGNWRACFGADGASAEARWASDQPWELPLGDTPPPAADAVRAADLGCSGGGFTRALQLAGARMVFALDHNPAVAPCTTPTAATARA